MKWFFAVFFSCSFVFLTVFGINCVYGYLFPVKYESEIEYACKKCSNNSNCEVNKAVVLSVINVESHFNENSISSRGAVGLMQVMSSTAEEVASQLGLKNFDLKNPSDNILIGTFYLNKLVQKFDNLETALCAYNAGPSNVKAWLLDSEKSDDGKTLKEIPFKETREYIQKFRQNFKYYQTKFR